MTISPIRTAAVLAVLTVAGHGVSVAQAEPGTPGSVTPADARATPTVRIPIGSARRSLLTRADWAHLNAGDAHEVISRLRPQWLRSRSVAGPNAQRSQILVYLDGMKLGSTAELRQINVSAVTRMEHLSGIEATRRFGSDHGAGAIVLETL